MKQLELFTRASVSPILAIAVGMTLFGGTPPASAALRHWTGAGSDAFWSNGANWSPADAPQPGDALVFPDSAARQTSTNDLVGLGESDTAIGTVDADGVALAAIQGLSERVESGKQKSEGRLQKLEAENAALKQTVDQLKELMKAMNDKLNGGGQ